MPKCTRLIVHSLFVLLVTCGFAASARAATITWTNGAGGDWGTSANWNSGAGPVPGSGDDAVITMDGTYTVTLNVNATVASLTLGGSTGTQTLSSSSPTLTLNGPSTIGAQGSLSMTNTTLGGAGSVTNQGSITLLNVTFSPALINQGVVTSSEECYLNGTLTTASGSMLRVLAATAKAGLLVANGFTNNGTIELTSANNAFLSHLDVISGVLLNAPGAAINAEVGSGGDRSLDAALDNHGTVTVNQASLMGSSYARVNQSDGTIAVNANTTVSAATSFTNSGTITVAASRTLTFTGSGLTLNGTGLGGPGAVVLNNVTATFNNDQSTATTNFTSMISTTINGPGSLTNAVGKSLFMKDVNVNPAFINQGDAGINGTVSLNGALTTVTGSMLRINGDAFCCAGHLVVANGFTNNGTIELSSFNGTVGSRLFVPSGVLVNAAGATINAEVGSGGDRVLEASLDNHGTITANQGPLSINKSSGVTVNQSDGTIALNVNTTVSNHTSFTNSGTITVAASRTLTFAGSGLTLNGTGLGGPGAVVLGNVTATFNNDQSTATTNFTSVGGTTINGSGSLTNAAGKSLSMRDVNINAAFINQGDVGGAGVVSLNGTLTTATGSTLRMYGDAFCCQGHLVVANGFTNNGTIELSSFSGPVGCRLFVASGVLVNAAGATINVEVGSGGDRTLEASLDNHGMINVNHGPLSINHPTQVNQSDGTIAVNGGDASVSGGGTFTNCGLITVASSRTLTYNGGTFTNGSTGVLSGTGTYNIGSTFNNGGTIAPGGILNINGSPTFASNAACSGGLATLGVPGPALSVDICGPGAGTGYDRLGVSGTATLGGVLNVNVPAGCCLSPGDDFRVLTAGAVVGTFSAINVSGHGNPVFTAQYDATGLTLHTESNSLTVNASAGLGGIIAPDGAVAAACGADPSFTISPNAGFEIADVLVDAVSVGAVANYTFTDIGDDHTIAASFVDVAGPAVQVLTPNGGETAYGDHVTKIRWTAVDNVSVDTVQVDYSLNGPGGPWVNIVRSDMPTDSVDWTVPNECSDNALVRVIGKDPSGNSGSDASDAEFHVRCGVAEVAGGAPKALVLHVPNPVRSAPVRMRISLPSAGTATVDVIAVTGQKVWSARLAGSPGDQELVWDGRADRAAVVEPGIYFARLHTPSGSRSVRFVLLR